METGGRPSGLPFVIALREHYPLGITGTPVIYPAPMFLIKAHDVSNGKSFFFDLLSTLVSGRPCPVITAGKNNEEMEKRLGSVLLEGGSMISLDNLSFDLETDLLCQILTQRIEWRGTIFATGNNVRVLGDLVRRALTCNLDAKVERPEMREFSFDPIARVLADREQYIAAGITIAREAASLRPLGGYGA
jgi:putative DNA primase/helicase